MLGIGLMFMILFQSWLLSVIGIIPNLLAAIFVLGLMGLIKLPLDMMTITFIDWARNVYCSISCTNIIAKTNY
jgi:predicted RND superfamily exporter protein